MFIWFVFNINLKYSDSNDQGFRLKLQTGFMLIMLRKCMISSGLCEQTQEKENSI